MNDSHPDLPKENMQLITDFLTQIEHAFVGGNSRTTTSLTVLVAQLKDALSGNENLLRIFEPLITVLEVYLSTNNPSLIIPNLVEPVRVLLQLINSNDVLTRQKLEVTVRLFVGDEFNGICESLTRVIQLDKLSFYECLGKAFNFQFAEPEAFWQMVDNVFSHYGILKTITAADFLGLIVRPQGNASAGMIREDILTGNADLKTTIELFLILGTYNSYANTFLEPIEN